MAENIIALKNSTHLKVVGQELCLAVTIIYRKLKADSPFLLCYNLPHKSSCIEKAFEAFDLHCSNFQRPISYYLLHFLVSRSFEKSHFLKKRVEISLSH